MSLAPPQETTQNFEVKPINNFGHFKRSNLLKKVAQIRERSQSISIIDNEEHERLLD